jgi:hypothetical protein
MQYIDNDLFYLAGTMINSAVFTSEAKSCFEKHRPGCPFTYEDYNQRPHLRDEIDKYYIELPEDHDEYYDTVNLDVERSTLEILIPSCIIFLNECKQVLIINTSIPSSKTASFVKSNLISVNRSAIPLDLFINRPLNPIINKPLNSTINKPLNSIINKPLNSTINKPLNSTINKTLKPLNPISRTLKPLDPINRTLKPLDPINRTLKPLDPINRTLKPLDPTINRTLKPIFNKLLSRKKSNHNINRSSKSKIKTVSAKATKAAQVTSFTNSYRDLSHIHKSVILHA